jgi:chemotaxis protein methyltransferase CheR
MENKKLIALLARLHDRRGIDFTQYKPSTLERRISARMLKNGFSSYEEYGAFLDKNPQECVELIDSITINVTDFFRNDESFEALEKQVIPEILGVKNSKGHRLLRVWSCGCSEGDEPYSIAMLLDGALENDRRDLIITIYGTDVDQRAIEKAKKAVYDGKRIEGIGSRLRKKYFNETEADRYSLKDVIRQMVTFRVHDVVNDKPFLNCDLILCRNLLIYFNKQLQEEVLLKFRECLSPGGFLVLGMTESLVGSAMNGFIPVNNRLRIYRRPFEEKVDIRTAEKLTQEQVDRIVKELVGRR